MKGKPNMPGDPLTERQRQIVSFIRSYTEKNGFAPTIREVGNGCGIRSPNGVCYQLELIEKKGAVSWTRGKNRTLRVLREA